MRRAERGQHADQRDPAAVRPGRVTGPGQEQVQLAGERGERAAGQRHRRGVQLQVVAVELDGDPGVGGQSRTAWFSGSGWACVIDQEQLELGADRDRAGPEAGPPEQLARAPTGTAQAAHGTGRNPARRTLPGDLGSHGQPPLPAARSAGRSAPRAGSGRSGPWPRRPRPQRQLAQPGKLGPVGYLGDLASHDHAPAGVARPRRSRPPRSRPGCPGWRRAAWYPPRCGTPRCAGRGRS